ncbi:MAG: hypothetical protein HYX42_01585 [Polaromonas sp.]|uniref:hypothetical protein n=1 Tax=Polaromonas sp. TaxID=1869339 RepID=UPI0025D24C36|nr:hypothetical protein [Polaromonas sp.]MBI2724919.1 hypothetical protein [Polaromonas sp.]
MSDKPPTDWHTAAGFRLVKEWSGNNPAMIDATVYKLWKEERLRWLGGEKAVETWLSEQAIQEKAATASYIAQTPAYAQWAQAYAEKWNWLVCGECDTDGQLQRGMELWDMRHHEDPEAVAVEEFNESFDAEERERYKRINDARVWKPPTE